MPVTVGEDPVGPTSKCTAKTASAAVIEIKLAGVVVRGGGHGLRAADGSAAGSTGLCGVISIPSGNRIKILVWDCSGLVLIWKQLTQGAFRWPPVMDGVMKLTAVEFAALFDGLDWTRVQTVRRIPTPTAAA
ncbi:MAG: IS66 family insertion sequence element accessory protein TnpB [Acetobacteraceae bacterium]|nr:IS66 family insertion sequence element accessory protein TnpB [Acetobacteraceae bacterium]